MERKAEFSGDTPVWFVADENNDCRGCMFDGDGYCKVPPAKCNPNSRTDGLDGHFEPRNIAETMMGPSDDFISIVKSAISTAERAMHKYPQPNYVISKIAEESGELVKAAIHSAEGRDSLQHVRDEMIDTIAMLYRLWIEEDQIHGCPPVKDAPKNGVFLEA